MTTENERERAQLERQEQTAATEEALFLVEVVHRAESGAIQYRRMREATEKDLNRLGWVKKRKRTK